MNSADTKNGRMTTKSLSTGDISIIAKSPFIDSIRSVPIILLHQIMGKSIHLKWTPKLGSTSIVYMKIGNRIHLLLFD